MTAGEGINFRVIDVDTFSRNEIVGRCFCPATVMQQAMKNNSPIVMSLGDGCAEIAFHSFRNHIERAQLHTATRLHYIDPCTILLRPCPTVRAQTASVSSRCWYTDR